MPQHVEQAENQAAQQWPVLPLEPRQSEAAPARLFRQGRHDHEDQRGRQVRREDQRPLLQHCLERRQTEIGACGQQPDQRIAEQHQQIPAEPDPHLHIAAKEVPQARLTASRGSHEDRPKGWASTGTSSSSQVPAKAMVK